MRIHFSGLENAIDVRPGKKAGGTVKIFSKPHDRG
jgi:hypothetical protein